ncbi:hypothetical protein LV779_35235 [Streptomyces thinghirensis]|nr:hypothetical protein [Streptomyces thinghirensis]
MARTCPDTLAGARDKALVLTDFHYALACSGPAGLLAGDVTLTPRSRSSCRCSPARPKHSVRDAKISPYQQDPGVCSVEGVESVPGPPRYRG